MPRSEWLKVILQIYLSKLDQIHNAKPYGVHSRGNSKLKLIESRQLFERSDNHQDGEHPPPVVMEAANLLFQLCQASFFPFITFLDELRISSKKFTRGEN